VLSLIVAAVMFAGLAALSRPVALAAADKPAAATFEVYKDRAGEFRWRLRTANSQIIAISGDGYKNKADCMAGVDSVKKNAPLAKVEEQPAAAEK
jgi:uncharacterized protein YegP (UPF0339 family)